VVFSKLSKLLNQEDALSAPCSHAVISALRRRALAGRRNAAERRNTVTLSFAAPKSSRRQALMNSRWWRRMHGQSAPVQGQAGPSWQDGAEMSILTPTVVRFSGGVEREKNFCGNHGCAVFLHHRARR
jgi:hypothetical protein